MRMISPRGLALAFCLALGLAAPASAADYHPTTLLVDFDQGTTAAERSAVHGAVGATVANRFSDLGIDVVTLPDGLTPPQARERYLRRATVESAGLNRVVRKSAAPNDTLFKDQWGFRNTGQTVTGSLVKGVGDFDIDADEAWTSAMFSSDAGTLVAVLDTGIDRTHVEFLDKVKACATATSALGIVTEGTCSDDNLHGTHTAGTVAAETNNGVGVAGTAPNAQLAIFKFLNAAGAGFLADEIAAIDWARKKGARIASMSFGSYSSSSEEHDAIKRADAAGMLLVAAAGNDGDDTQNYPATYPEVMSVASTTADNSVSWFSNCNSDVEIGAPGEDIWSTFPSNSYGVISGTSMATPHVAGAAALLMSEKGLNASQARSTLKSTATAVNDDPERSACNGVTQVNLPAALGTTSGGGGSTDPVGSGTIAGTVTEQRTKAAIASATVDCGAGGSATTGTDGTYSIASVPTGSHTCTASKTGYASKSQTVSVSDGATTTADFVLRKR